MKEIPLTRGKVAIVDDADYEELAKHRWYAVPKSKRGHLWYACRGKGPQGAQKKIYMHRTIMGFPDSFIDHINRDGLDNRRENLRTTDQTLNMANQAKFPGTSSKYKGVYYRANRDAWIAHIKHKEKTGKQIRIGYFKSEDEAALAYNAAALELFGEHARLNEVRS